MIKRILDWIFGPLGPWWVVVKFPTGRTKPSLKKHVAICDMYKLRESHRCRELRVHSYESEPHAEVASWWDRVGENGRVK